MHGLILAAGEADRLGDHDIPAVCLELHGRTLFEWHLDSLARICDAVTVVLGKGFVGDDPAAMPPDRQGTFDGEIVVRQPGLADPAPEVHEDRVRAHLASEHDVRVTAVLLPHWTDVGNAESCRIGLQETSGDVLLVNGDVIYRDYVVQTIVAEYYTRFHDAEQSMVAVKPGIQSETTAVRWDRDRRITAYGAIEGHRLAGIFVLCAEHVPPACQYLATKSDAWFPVVFPVIDATYVPIPPESQFAIDTPAHLERAREGVARWVKGIRSTP